MRLETLLLGEFPIFFRVKGTEDTENTENLYRGSGTQSQRELYLCVW